MAVERTDYVTVPEGAALLGVSRSTLRRWIDQGRLPARRFGRRRVLIKRHDLAQLLAPASDTGGSSTLKQERARLGRPLAPLEQQAALAALDAARQLRAELLAWRGGVPFPDSVELIRTMRQKRARAGA